MIYASIFLLVLCFQLGITAANPSCHPPVRPGWNLVWSDEFQGPAGTPPNQSNWVYNIGDVGNGWGNWELEYYTNSTENVRLDGKGNLVIEAKKNTHNLTCYYGPCNYTSGRITTGGKFSHKYGLLEARIKIPTGQGMWPAFWMLGNDFLTKSNWPYCGEIDIMEYVGKTPKQVYGTLHGTDYHSQSRIYNLTNGKDMADEFHSYSVIWTAQDVTWFVDDVKYGQIMASSVNATQWVFNAQEFYFLLNVAVGGTWPGSPNATTVFPQQMLVDYVRVYDKKKSP